MVTEITEAISELDKKMLRLWDTLDAVQKRDVLEYTMDVALADNTMSVNQLREYNDDIEAAEKEITSGNFVTHDDALKQLSKWKL